MTFCHQNVRLIARIDFDPRDSHHSIYQFKFIHRMNENLIQECQYLIYFCFSKDAIHSFKSCGQSLWNVAFKKQKPKFQSIFKMETYEASHL